MPENRTCWAICQAWNFAVGLYRFTAFSDDLRMVHPAGWAAIILWLAVWPTMLVPAILRKSPNPAFVPLVLPVPAVVIGLYILMVFWVNADATRRRLNALQWTVVAALVPYGIGFIVYLHSRQPMRGPCTGCGADTI